MNWFKKLFLSIDQIHEQETGYPSPIFYLERFCGRCGKRFVVRDIAERYNSSNGNRYIDTIEVGCPDCGTSDGTYDRWGAHLDLSVKEASVLVENWLNDSCPVRYLPSPEW